MCRCGNRFTVGSTKPSINVALCNKCHPFFTGQQKFVDVVGRIEKFERKQKKAEVFAQSLKTKKAKKEKSIDEKGPKTLREMLMEKG